MSLHVLATGLSRDKDPEPLKLQADFRKATRNMMLAWLSIEEALAPLSNALPRDQWAAVAMVLGSGWGELDVTKNFLKGLADAGLARPILFQNSLHNSTLGFLSMRLAFTGPSVTVSNRCFTGENGLDVAQLILDEGHCRFCVVTGVDTLVPDFGPALESVYPPPTRLGEGAASVLLANDAGVSASGIHPLATLEEVTYPRRPSREAPVNAESHEGYYESDAIERLVDALRREPALEAGGAGSLILDKPDGTRSVLRWTRGFA